jgi:tripartite ATP-independent transporter DctP family solute receptor
MLLMKKSLEDVSGDSMTMQIYPSAQLGTERDLIEMLQIGSIGMTKVSASPLVSFVPEMKIFDVPYVFRDHKHFLQVLDSDIGEELLQAARPARLIGIGYFDAGSRSFYTSEKVITQPDDLQGLKIRVQESQMAMSMVSSLGGSPTPIAYGELYTALQQGVVDGAENNPPSYYLARHFEVAPYFTLDEHTAVPDVLLLSRYVWDSLNTQQQKWLKQAVNVSINYQREQWKKDTDKAMEEVIKAGVHIQQVDTSLFQAKVKSLHDSFVGTSLAETIARIQEVGRD